MRCFIARIPACSGWVPGVPGGVPGVPCGVPGVPGGVPGVPCGVPGVPGGVPGVPGGFRVFRVGFRLLQTPDFDCFHSKLFCFVRFYFRPHFGTLAFDNFIEFLLETLHHFVEFRQQIFTAHFALGMTFGLEKEGTKALKARNEITTQARLRSKSSLFREINYCEI